MGGLQTPSRAGQDTQSCRALGSCPSLEGQRRWEHRERGREAKCCGARNVGAPDTSWERGEELSSTFLVDRQPLEKGSWKTHGKTTEEF